MQIKCVVLVSLVWTTLAFSLTSVAAVPLEAALQACQQQVEAESSGTRVEEIEFTPGSELPNGTVVVRWQTARGITGYCRIAPEDGVIVDFFHPHAVPRGQRPIETVFAFQTNEYTVRVVRLLEQLYMNVYNRRTDRVELNRELVRSTQTDEGITYTNLLGQRLYRSIVSPDGSYRLQISLGSSLVVYDQVGQSLIDAAVLDSAATDPAVIVLPTRSPALSPASSLSD